MRFPPIVLFVVLLGLAVAPAAAFAGSAPDSLDAEEGSLTPVAGKKGVYTLVLRDIDERPATVRALLEAFFADDAPDPQATLEADDEETVRLRLTSATYNAARDVLRIRVVATGARLPRDLDDVSLSLFGAARGGSVSVFNTDQQPITVSVNGGRSFDIQGAFPPDYTPQKPRIGPDFDNRPGPNVVGYGQNNLTVSLFGSPVRLTFTIPPSSPVSSLQLYLFSDFDAVRWTLLNNGRFLASGSSS